VSVLRTGLIGAHIGRSRFADALAIICADHGMTLQYQAIDSAGVAAFDFADAVATCRKAGWQGVAVTHPFKPRAAELAGARASETVRRLGACNTLLFGTRAGAANTDHSGFLAVWQAVFANRPPGRVAMAGAGGVARAIAPALAELGARDIAIWDTNDGLASDLAARIGPPARAIPASMAAQAAVAADGLVNATPLGMADFPGSAFEQDWISRQQWAFDAVYTPIDTIFLQASAAAGMAVLSGFDLFRFMAIDSFAALSGLRPDPTRALGALETLRAAPVSA
jgi:quinate/shikimate dehydrogenase (NAD+)